MKTITNKRYKLFIEKLGYTDEDAFKDITKFNVLYMKFTSDIEELYLKEKQIKQVYDFIDFDNYCIEYLKNNEVKHEEAE